MKTKKEKLSELREELRLTKTNIRTLKKAKKSCTCDGKKPHYHELLAYDSESGDEYFETSDAKHKRLIERLGRDVERIESQLIKLRAQK
jgi:hypothetical protein